MISYIKFTDKHGTDRFMIVDDTKRPRKRLIAKAKIPVEELRKLYSTQMDSLDDLNIETVDENDHESGQSKQESGDCVFGDGYGNRRKFLQGRIVRICEEHWQTKTTGEIVSQLNHPKERQPA